MRDFDLSEIQVTASSGLDAVIENNPALITPPRRMRVASLQKLAEFTRLSEDMLIHKSERELWSLQKEGEKYYISRLFDANGAPIKG